MSVQKYTLELFAKERNLTRQAAINLLSKLKAEGLVQTQGGGKQKRIYTLFSLPQKPTNGFYDVVNKYSPIKLVAPYKHYTYGNYTIEHAIIDGLQIGDARTKEATMYLFWHVKNWKRLFDLAKKKKYIDELYTLYDKARTTIRTKKIPKRYEQ